LRAIADDPSLRWYPRLNAVECVLADAAAQGAEELEAAIDWVAALVDDNNADPEFRANTVTKLLDFPRGRHRALLETIAREQKSSEIIGIVFVHKDIEVSFERGDCPQWLRIENAWKFYTPESIRHRQERWAKDDARREERRIEKESDDSPWTKGDRISLGDTYVRCRGRDPFRLRTLANLGMWLSPTDRDATIASRPAAGGAGRTARNLSASARAAGSTHTGIVRWGCTSSTTRISTATAAASPSRPTARFATTKCGGPIFTLVVGCSPASATSLAGTTVQRERVEKLNRSASATPATGDQQHVGSTQHHARTAATAPTTSYHRRPAAITTPKPTGGASA